ncbi:MAG: alpha/beta fold hydrolase [Deltaproteobacteria bacterium]|nr:alpha/beta fold hydrolase [Deltaproteobacteria bacterium]MDQ3297715.1 alpha/beta hydrolase [Myxococcota bacterium]
MPTLAVNGTTLHYEDSGAGSTGETIVFSHGLLWGTELFAPQIEALRGRYRCVAWDHRGQGRSAADHRDHIGIELVWQDAVALLEALGLTKVHFCGLSMGGFVGMRMAARRPDLVRSLILIETSSDPEPIENVSRYRLLARVVKLLGPRVVRGRVAPIMLGKTILTERSRHADVERFLTIMTSRRDIWRAVHGVIDRAGIHDELARVTLPTVILVGDEDLATPRSRAEKIAGAIAGAQVVVIPRAGHSSTVEEPAAVIAAMESFLGALPAARDNGLV